MNNPIHDVTMSINARLAAGMLARHQVSTVASASWGQTPDKQDVALYTLRNKHGIEVRITNYGATVVSLVVPDRHGQGADIVLGFDALLDYVTPGKSPMFGCIAGRYANRIGGGKFTLDGTTYSLATNNAPSGKPCHLHGGLRGFDKAVWLADPFTSTDGDEGLQLTCVSKDGEEGYPGTLTLTVTYVLGHDNALHIGYKATTDKATILNPTNHSYFNLRGHDAGSIVDHQLTLHASHYTPTDDGMIPTGEIASVSGTPFDFTAPQAIGARIDLSHEQLKQAGGYDHNFILDRKNKDELMLAATVYEPTSGRVMDVLTTEPGMQLYSSNFLPPPDVSAEHQLIGKGGAVYSYRGALCLEAQHFPDAPNKPTFPSTVLRPGQIFTSQTVYRFSAR